MAKMTDAVLRKVVEQSIQDSTWFDDTEAQDNYRKALDSYYGRNKPKVTDGRSTANDNSVADMLEAVVSQIMPAFDFDEVVVFDPLSASDYDQSRLESRVCNSYLRDKNRGYGTLQEALRNCLLLRNGILKVWAEEKVDVLTRRYSDLNSLELDNVLTTNRQEQTIEVVGEPVIENDDSISLSVKTTTYFRRLAIDSTDPIEFLVTKNWNSIDLQDVPLCGEHYFLSASELRDLGISQRQINKLTQTDTETSISRQARNRNETTNNLSNNGDKSRTMYEIFELYMLIDFDGDGISERRKILYGGGTSGGTVLQNFPWLGVPYASGTPLLQPSRWLGMSLYDKLGQLELTKTDALRQYADNLAYANNAEVLAVDGMVVMDDLRARRPGGINRVDRIDAVRELTFNSNGAESQAFLNYMDQVRSERGGASLDLQAAELQLAGETAHGIERQYTSKEQLTQLMTRTLAETLIRQTFLLIHRVLREEFPQQRQLQIGGEFVAYEAGSWPARDELTVVAGMSVGERRDRRAALEGVLVQQEKLHAAGFGDGQMIDLKTYHSTLLDWTSAGGVPNARRYWIDPATQASQQAQQQATQARQAAQAQQQIVAERLFSTQVQIEDNKNSKDLLTTAAQLRFDYWKEVLDSALQEQQFDLQFGGTQGEPAHVDALQAQGERQQVAFAQ